MTVLQDQSAGAPDPYLEGEELILFLKSWDETQEAFRLVTMSTPDRSDRAVTFLIRNRRVVRSPDSLSRYTGGDVESLLADLRRLAAAK